MMVPQARGGEYRQLWKLLPRVESQLHGMILQRMVNVVAFLIITVLIPLKGVVSLEDTDSGIRSDEALLSRAFCLAAKLPFTYVVSWPDDCLSAETRTIIPKLLESSNEAPLSSLDSGTLFAAHGGAFSCTGWIDSWGRANSSSSSEIPDLERLGDRDGDRDSDFVSGTSRKIELPREWDTDEERDRWPLSAIEKSLGLVR